MLQERKNSLQEKAIVYSMFFDEIVEEYGDTVQADLMKNILIRIADDEELFLTEGITNAWFTDSNNVSYIFPRKLVNPFVP